MATFKEGDIAVCIKSFIGRCTNMITPNHPNPPKKGEEFPVLGVDIEGLLLGGVCKDFEGDDWYWNPSYFKHKTDPLFESKIDQIEKSIKEESFIEQVLINKS